MVRATENSLIIEIPSGSPVEDLLGFVDAIATIIMLASIDDENVNINPETLHYAVKLLSNMQCSYKQINLVAQEN